MTVHRALGRRGAALALAVAIAAALTVRYVGRSSPGAPHVFSGPTMGSLYHVTVDADLTDEEQLRVRSVIEERLGRVERVLSTYDSASDVSRFNRHATTEPFPVAAELVDVLLLARDVSVRSGGALDVTVAPLVDAWGFGPVDQGESIPDEALLAKLRLLVGYERVLIDEAAGTVAKTDPAVRIDLSALGQGYAVDVVAAALTQLGLASFLVELSGELAAVGTRRDGAPWRIGIEAPVEGPAGLWGTVELTGEGVSTSGDYLNYIELDGVRYTHLVDPRTGRPVPMLGIAVSVVHESVAVADAWDTALAVLGPDAGYAIAEREGIGALFITRVGDGFAARITPALAGRVREMPVD